MLKRGLEQLKRTVVRCSLIKKKKYDLLLSRHKEDGECEREDKRKKLDKISCVSQSAFCTKLFSVVENCNFHVIRMARWHITLYFIVLRRVQ
jgi:hypothetical protein